MNGELTITVNELEAILVEHFHCEVASVNEIVIYETDKNTGKREVRHKPIMAGDMLNIKFNLRG